MGERAEITELLAQACAGDAQAGEVAYALIYDELKACARRRSIGLRQGATLSATALVSETYLRLCENFHGPIRDRGHYFALAARAMRQIVIDHARRKGSLKRGGADIVVELGDENDVVGVDTQRALELDAALDALQLRDAALAKVVELHFFAGLSFLEIGVQLDRHERTVRHDWELARAFLQRAIGLEPAS